MTEKELRIWMRKESLSDTWFASPGEDHVDGDLLTLEQIFNRYGNDPATAKDFIWILHESQQNRKNPAWVQFSLKSFEGDTASNARPSQSQSPSHGRSGQHGGRSSERSKRRRRGMMFQISILLLFVAAGITVWYFVTREEAPVIRFVTEEEVHSQMLANLEQNLIRNSPADSERGEPIRTVVSATQRMLMIKNSNLENWPSFYMRITVPNGNVYECDFNEVIPAYSTLSISMRRIVTDKGQSLTREDLKSGTTIELRVPGYKDWSSKL